MIGKNVSLTEDQFKWLQKEKKRTGDGANSIIRKALREYIERQKKVKR